MPIPGMPPLSFSLNPSSSAASESGLDNLGGHGGGMTGAINVGGDGGANSWISGLTRDAVILVALAFAARYFWRMK